MLTVSVTAGDRGGSYETTASRTFPFVGAFDLRPSESVNIWPARPNATVEVLRAAREIAVVVPEEAASWGLFAVPVASADGAAKSFVVGVGEAQWRSGFTLAPDTWEGKQITVSLSLLSRSVSLSCARCPT